MKLKLLSDLHLEMSAYHVRNDENNDVLILAGDILISQTLHDYNQDNIDMVEDPEDFSMGQIRAVRYRQFVKDCSNSFNHVIVIAGNHEFYNGNFHKGLEYLREEYGQYPNVHFLEDDCIEIDDVLFVGGTLWTDLNNFDQLTEIMIKNMMNDYHVIKNDAKGYRKLLPVDTQQRHVKTLNYIKQIVTQNPDKKIVVVTHHAPSSQSIMERYKEDHIMNGGYYSELSEFILDNPQIKKWFHGHMHSHFRYQIGETEVICNPRGYKTNIYNEDTNWDEFISIEV